MPEIYQKLTNTVISSRGRSDSSRAPVGVLSPSLYEPSGMQASPTRRRLLARLLPGLSLVALAGCGEDGEGGEAGDGEDGEALSVPAGGESEQP
jgi:hypothetical protein